MKRILCIIFSLLVLMATVGCNREEALGGFTESEIGQINAAQDAALTGDIPQSWLHSKGTELIYEDISYKTNSLEVIEELPKNLQKQFDENAETPLNKYQHFLLLNLTMKNTSDEEVETLLNISVETIDNCSKYDKFEPILIEKYQYPSGHDYYRFTFKPNEEITTDVVFVAHERQLVYDLYFSPSFYACSYVEVLDAPFEKKAQAVNQNLEIWDEIFTKLKSPADSVIEVPLPKPAQGTLEEKDVVVCDDNQELTFVIKNMERDYALEYFKLLIFEGYNTVPYYVDKNMPEISEPNVDSKNGTISIYAGFAGFAYDIAYTESTKQMRVNICSIDKAWKASKVSADK